MTRREDAERDLDYCQHGRHVCTPTVAVSLQDLANIVHTMGRGNSLQSAGTRTVKN